MDRSGARSRFRIRTNFHKYLDAYIIVIIDYNPNRLDPKCPRRTN